MTAKHSRLKTIGLILACAVPGLLTVPASQALTLQEAAALALENSSRIQSEGITIQLKAADRDLAYQYFDPSFDASLTYTDTRDYLYPPEIRKFGEDFRVKDFIPDDTTEARIDISLSKLFLSGIQTRLRLVLTEKDSVHDRVDVEGIIDDVNALYPTPGGNRTVQDYSPITSGRVHFTLNIPLYGRGEVAEGIGNYYSMQGEYLAALAQKNHQVSEILAEVINAYWDNRLAVYRQQMRSESLARALEWEQGLNAMIERMPNPAAVRRNNAQNLSQIQGFIEDRRSALSSAESELARSRANLANALGVSQEKIREIGDASRNLSVDFDSLRNQVNVDAWSTLAIENRQDIRALRYEDIAAAELLKWMNNYNKPELDLQLDLVPQMASFGSSGLRAYGDALGNNMGGTGYIIGLHYSQKLGHSAGRARVSQARLNRMQNQINLDNALRSVDVELSSLSQSLLSSLDAVESAFRASVAFRQSVEAMQSERQALDSAYRRFEIERDWMNAAIESASMQTELAKVIVDIRHETGTLVSYAADGSLQINTDAVMQLPQL